MILFGLSTFKLKEDLFEEFDEFDRFEDEEDEEEEELYYCLFWRLVEDSDYTGCKGCWGGFLSLKSFKTFFCF